MHLVGVLLYHWAHENREDGRHSPLQVLDWHKGTMYPAEFLDRILFATRYTCHLDKNGYIRFQNWKLYGERGLAQAPVTIWIYEGSLKIEHRAVTLSKYTVELDEKKQRYLQAVSHPRLSTTPFHSPQLTLFDLGPGEWLMYWKTPDQGPVHRRRRVPGIVQMPLFDPFPEEQAVGAEGEGEPRRRTHLRLMQEPLNDRGVEE
jgi:hypothetical protein